MIRVKTGMISMKKTIKLLSIFFFAVAISFTFILLVSAKGLAAPALSTKNISDSIVISWEKVKGAESYEVYKLGSDKKWVKKASSKKTSFTDSNVKNGNTYKYKVRAVSKSEKSGFGRIKQVFLKAPTLKTITNTASGVKLKWKNNASARTYRIYRKEASTGYKLIAKVKSETTSFVDKTAKNGVTYTYTIASQSGDYRSKGNLTPLKINFVSQVKNLSVKNSPNGVTLTWSKVKEAAGYVVYRKTSGTSDWVKAGTVKDAQKFVDKKTAYGKKNYYKVCAYVKSSSPGAFSDKVSVYSVDPNKKMVALTFDDGPYRPVTNQILDALKKYNARATFFVVGSRLGTYKDCLERENKLGCEIACHTFNHASLTSLSESSIKKEISDTNTLVKKYTGQTVKLVRAPGGAVNSKVKNTVSYPLVNWSVDTEDWKNRNADTTFANFKKDVKDGSIVLMHDLYASTGNAASRIIPWLVCNGYQIVTVSEMMDAKGVRMQNGGLYTRAG